MLIRFSVENFLSFKKPQFFSMAAGRHTRHQDHIIQINNNRILKGAFFFGANASGKSNLIKAVGFARDIVINGIEDTDFNNKHFRIDPLFINKPGVFQFDILANDHLYSYGFSVSYLTQTIESEWLYLYDNGEKCIFERYKESDKKIIKTEIDFSQERQAQRFSIYSEDIPDEKLLLADIASRSLNDNMDFLAFNDVWKWFEHLIVIFPSTQYLNKNKILDSSDLSELLCNFDTGIEKVLEREQSIDKVLEFVPESKRHEIIKMVNDALLNKVKDINNNITVAMQINGKRFVFNKRDNELFAKLLMMDHGNPGDLFNLSNESDGTQRLFDLIPLYQKGQQEYVIFVDELDRSFHTKLTIEYIQNFFLRALGSKTQLIVTTHDSNVMDLDLLRQDEIWFIERKKDHSSCIYPLNKFQVRFDKKISKDYLLGRYGAIPCISQLDMQIEEEHEK